jgi:hypothetical protein
MLEHTLKKLGGSSTPQQIEKAMIDSYAEIEQRLKDETRSAAWLD